jgi:hypothetical protein
MSATETIPATTLPAGTWKLDPTHSSASFAVKHMVVATFRGRFEKFDATLTVPEHGEPKFVGTVQADSIEVKDEQLAGCVYRARPLLGFAASAPGAPKRRGRSRRSQRARHGYRREISAVGQMIIALGDAPVDSAALDPGNAVRGEPALGRSHLHERSTFVPHSGAGSARVPWPGVPALRLSWPPSRRIPPWPSTPRPKNQRPSLTRAAVASTSLASVVPR